jgi:hypothetical protein
LIGELPKRLKIMERSTPLELESFSTNVRGIE